MMTYRFILLMALSLCVLTASGCVTGKTKMPVVFRDAGTDLYGFRSPQGEIVISPVYNVVQPFSQDGIAAVADNTGWVYIDRTGKHIARAYIFDNGPDYFSEGFTRIVKDGKIGFMNTQGQVVIPPMVDFALPFSGGYAPVCLGCRLLPQGEHSRIQGGKWGYINPSGKLVIPALYDTAEPFKDGTAHALLDGHRVVISPPVTGMLFSGNCYMALTYGPGEETKIRLPLLPHKTQIATLDKETPFIRTDGIYINADGSYMEGFCRFIDAGGTHWAIIFSAEPLAEKNRSVLTLLIRKQKTIILQTDFAFRGAPYSILTMGVSPFHLNGLSMDGNRDLSICLIIQKDTVKEATDADFPVKNK